MWFTCGYYGAVKTYLLINCLLVWFAMNRKRKMLLQLILFSYENYNDMMWLVGQWQALNMSCYMPWSQYCMLFANRIGIHQHKVSSMFLPICLLSLYAASLFLTVSVFHHFYHVMLCIAWTLLSQDVWQSVHLSGVHLTITRHCVEVAKLIVKLFHRRVATPF